MSYCDILGKCQHFDSEGPFNQLTKLIFNPVRLSKIKDWIIVSVDFIFVVFRLFWLLISVCICFYLFSPVNDKGMICCIIFLPMRTVFILSLHVCHM